MTFCLHPFYFLLQNYHPPLFSFFSTKRSNFALAVHCQKKPSTLTDCAIKKCQVVGNTNAPMEKVANLFFQQREWLVLFSWHQRDKVDLNSFHATTSHTEQKHMGQGARIPTKGFRQTQFCRRMESPRSPTLFVWCLFVTYSNIKIWHKEQLAAC